MCLHAGPSLLANITVSRLESTAAGNSNPASRGPVPLNVDLRIPSWAGTVPLGKEKVGITHHFPGMAMQCAL